MSKVDAKRDARAKERMAKAEEVLKDLPKIVEVVHAKAEDGDLSKAEIDDILAVVEEYQKERILSPKELDAVQELCDAILNQKSDAKVPLPLKIIGVINIIEAVGLILALIIIGAAIAIVGFEESFGSGYTVTTIVLGVLYALTSIAGGLFLFFLGVRLLKNRARHAAYILRVVIALDVVTILLEVMLFGISSSMIASLVSLAISIAVAIYLDPSHLQERQLGSRLQMLDAQARAEQGKLGLDLYGKGYIRLDFFNLFWLFVIGCVVGLVVEIIWHMVVVDPGVYQDRAGLLFGPFSPIYGVGAVLMTLALNKHRNANFILIFVVCTIIGGAFEYFVSWFMEVAFGAIAWDYSDKFLNINGRTCLSFASMFGVLGLVWIKALLPVLLNLINRIPWKIRYIVTGICAVLMAIDCFMTVQALDCWYERLSGQVPTTPVECFYAEYFDNDFMQNRFQSMTITPDGGHQ